MAIVGPLTAQSSAQQMKIPLLLSEVNATDIAGVNNRVYYFFVSEEQVVQGRAQCVEIQVNCQRLALIIKLQK